MEGVNGEKGETSVILLTIRYIFFKNSRCMEICIKCNKNISKKIFSAITLKVHNQVKAERLRTFGHSNPNCTFLSPTVRPFSTVQTEGHPQVYLPIIRDSFHAV